METKRKEDGILANADRGKGLSRQEIGVNQKNEIMKHVLIPLPKSL
jgi:hypothetical protein